MSCAVSSINGLLERAAGRLDAEGYAAIPWDRIECERLAAEALRRGVAALRGGGECVIHPLGFARIPLSPWALERPRIAVHVWSGDWHALDIHDHCYDFVSVCIAGEIRHSYFEPTHSTDAFACDALHYKAGSCHESESRSGEGQRLALVGEQTIAAHDALSLHHSALHRAQPLTDVAITVQFQSPCIKAAANVFRAAGALHHVKGERVEPLSGERLAALLEGARR